MSVVEEWLVRFQNPVAGVAGQTAVFDERQVAIAWIAAHPEAGVCELQRVTTSAATDAVFGKPWPEAAQVPGVTPPAPVTQTRTHFPTVPRG